MGRGSTRRPSPASRLVALVALLVAVAILTGCSLPRPPGEGTIRYRDQVFTAFTETRDVQYGTRPRPRGNPVALKMDLYHRRATPRPSGRSSSGSTEAASAAGTRRPGRSPISPNLRQARLRRRLDQLPPPGNFPRSASTVNSNCITAAMAAQHDAQAAVRGFRAKASTYGVDPSESASAALRREPGPRTSVGRPLGDPGDSGNPGYSSKVGGFMTISGAFPPDSTPSSTPATSGILFHGTADPRRALPSSVATAPRCSRTGVPAYPGDLSRRGPCPRYTNTTSRSSRSRTTSSTTSSICHMRPGRPPPPARAEPSPHRR